MLSFLGLTLLSSTQKNCALIVTTAYQVPTLRQARLFMTSDPQDEQRASTVTPWPT